MLNSGEKIGRMDGRRLERRLEEWRRERGGEGRVKRIEAGKGKGRRQSDYFPKGYMEKE